MHKSDLVQKLMDGSLSKENATLAVNLVFQNIQTALECRDKVTITDFGTFEAVLKKERQGRNPRTGETITIPAQHSVKFKPGKRLKEAVK